MVFSIRTAWWMKLFASLMERAWKLLNLPPEGIRLYQYGAEQWGISGLASLQSLLAGGAAVFMPHWYLMAPRWKRGWDMCSFQFVEGGWSEFSRPAGWRGTYHHLHISMVDGHWRFGGLLLKSITTFLVMRFIQDKISKNKPLLLLFFQFAAKKKNMSTNFCFKCTTPKYVKMNKLSSPKIRPKATHSEFKVWRGNKLRPRC